MPHPPYSPDLTPSDFVLFCVLDEKYPQREMFSNVKEVKN